ncbi:MAG: hypothetical protein QOF58_1279 [Pseudonocardiales bacterium]|nr:hypothetical protein [Pseudonocardiales bacterium]
MRTLISLLAASVLLVLPASALADGLHLDAQDRDVAVTVQGNKLVWPGGSMTLSNPKAVAEALNPRADTDGDGVPDPLTGDKCPDKPGPGPDGCPVAPPPPADTQPTANFSVTPNPGFRTESTKFAFTGTCEDDPCTYQWRNAGGTVHPSSQGTTASYTYQANGTKTVELTVTDADGDTNVATKDFQVVDRPAPTSPAPAAGAPAAPTLTNPVTLTVSNTNKSVSASSTTDCIIQQSGTLTGNVIVTGCNDIIWRGMRVSIPVQPNGTGSAFANARQGPEFANYTGHLYVEDFRVGGDDMAEGIIFNPASSTAKATFYNGRCELVSRAYTRMVNGKPAGRAPTWPTDMGTTRGVPTYDGLATWATGRYWDEHNDCFQSWAMPQAIHIQKVTGVSPSQFDYLEPDTANRTLTMKDVNARQYTAPWDGSKVSDQFFWASGWDVTLDNVWADNTRHGLPGVKQGVPPLGDFVP